MTAIDELKRLLDERGVDWDVFKVSSTEYVHWTNDDGLWCAASVGELRELSKLHINILSTTPEQAIAATLGNDGVGRTNDGVAERGTCHIVEERASDTDAYWEDTLVMECGAEFVWSGSDNPVYCPYCGGKAVE